MAESLAQTEKELAKVEFKKANKTKSSPPSNERSQNITQKEQHKFPEGFVLVKRKEEMVQKNKKDQSDPFSPVELVVPQSELEKEKNKDVAQKLIKSKWETFMYSVKSDSKETSCLKQHFESKEDAEKEY